MLALAICLLIVNAVVSELTTCQTWSQSAVVWRVYIATTGDDLNDGRLPCEHFSEFRLSDLVIVAGETAATALLTLDQAFVKLKELHSASTRSHARAEVHLGSGVFSIPKAVNIDFRAGNSSTVVGGIFFWPQLIPEVTRTLFVVGHWFGHSGEQWGPHRSPSNFGLATQLCPAKADVACVAQR